MTTAPDEGTVVFYCARFLVGKEKTTMNTKLAIRVSDKNVDHHLWNNNGTWWCHYTEHLPDYTKRRVRRNLRTADRDAARNLRDSIFFGSNPGRIGGAA